MVVFSNLANACTWLYLSSWASVALGSIRTCLSVVYPRNVVHAACDEEDAVWRPGQIVDLGSHGAAHVLDPPCLLVFQAILPEVLVEGRVLGRDPEEDVAVVSGAGEYLSYTIA